jgi:hypothetical protein
MATSEILRLLRSLILALPLLLGSAGRVEAIQTQTTDGNVEVGVMKVVADQGILTVQLVYHNTSNVDLGIKYPVSEVYYIDEKERKKYPVLKDSHGEWVAAPTAYGSIATQHGWGVEALPLQAGGKVIVWFKFPAPPASTTKINLIVPNLLPFENLSVSQRAQTDT